MLLTGHTGFKGAWLSLWLQTLQARVTGLAAPGAPTTPSLYELARVGEGMHERTVDVRDAQAVRDAVAEARPEVVLHLAAQPLVRRSHREPVLTYEVNVMGTVNVLEAVRLVGEEERAVVVVTSDKCYENPADGTRRFVEGEPARRRRSLLELEGLRRAGDGRLPAAPSSLTIPRGRRGPKSRRRARAT